MSAQMQAQNVAGLTEHNWAYLRALCSCFPGHEDRTTRAPGAPAAGAPLRSIFEPGAPAFYSAALGLPVWS